MKANVDNDTFKTILSLGELKSRLVFINGLSPVTGAVRAHYGEVERAKYKSQLLPAEKTKMIEECQKVINEMTDELDDFNAATSIAEGDIEIKGL
jgi:hypothetical protein